MKGTKWVPDPERERAICSAKLLVTYYVDVRSFDQENMEKSYLFWIRNATTLKTLVCPAK